jgi:Tol biopolymer transport system component
MRGWTKGFRAALVALAAMAVLPVLRSDALTNTGDIELASTANNNVTKGDAASLDVSLSADGRRVAFRSNASNLDPADTDATTDVYVKDLDTGQIYLASASANGTKGNDFSGAPSLSADGTRVAFQSRASNLHPDDPDVRVDVFVKDLVTGEVFLASTADDGTKGDSDSFSPSLSADGTRVAFESLAHNLDPAAPGPYGSQVYVKDLVTGDIVLASTNDSGAAANGFGNRSPDLSGNGRRVAFVSDATNLDPRVTGPFPNEAYVKDLDTGDITLANTAADGTKGDGVLGSDFPTLSADGMQVAFSSFASNLVPWDGQGFGNQSEVYVKDLATAAIVRASSNDAGIRKPGASRVPILSADATRVAFFSYAKLDPADKTGGWDVYVKDLVTGETVLATTDDSGTQTTLGLDGFDFAPSGRIVAFDSPATNLDPLDRDNILDVYVKVVADCHPAGAFGDGTLAQAIFGGQERERDGIVSSLEEQLEPHLGPAAPVANEVGCLMAALEDVAGGQ